MFEVGRKFIEEKRLPEGTRVKLGFHRGKLQLKYW
jgi:hypothetical protein